MRNILLACAVLLFSVPAAAQPGNFTFTIGDGRVTLIADGVPARTILLEWARLGRIQIVNAEKVVGPPLTLRLVDVPEEQALDVVLRSASGYVAAPRAAAVSQASRFDRIMILATSRPTASAPVPPPGPAQQPGFSQQPRFPQQPGLQPGMPQPGAMDPEPVEIPVEIQDDQVDDGTMPQPQDLPVAAPQPGQLPVTPPGPGNVGGPPPQPLPMTSPRPGLIAPAGQQPPLRPGPVRPPDSSPNR